jgi:hypothetical protein
MAKKRKSVKAGESVTLVIPRVKDGCLIERKTKSVKAGDRLVLVIPRAKVGCDI